jgi:hypothetical protein
MVNGVAKLKLIYLSMKVVNGGGRIWGWILPMTIARSGD